MDKKKLSLYEQWKNIDRSKIVGPDGKYRKGFQRLDKSETSEDNLDIESPTVAKSDLISSDKQILT